MPTWIRISGKVGEYSITSPSVEGMNPGITRPNPLSIQTPTKIAAQARARIGSRRRRGATTSTNAEAAINMTESQIQTTSAL